MLRKNRMKGAIAVKESLSLFKTRVKQTLSTLWPLLLLGAALFVLLAVVGGMVWQDYRTALIDSQTRQMELVVQSLADSIQFSLEEYNDRLDAAAQKLAENPDARLSLARSDTLRDVWIEDGNGEVVYSCYGVTAECDLMLTDSGSGITYWQYHSGDQHYLVLKKQVGEQTVCLVVDSEVLYQQLISDLHVGTNGYVMIKNADNRVILHPERKQWGIDVLEGRRKLYREDLEMSSLEELLRAQQEEASGIRDYYSYWWTDPDVPRVHKISAYRHLSIGSSFWIVSAVVDYDDLYKPVAESFQKVALLFLSIAVVMGLFLVLVFRLQQKERRNVTEINDLKSLNATLEELHRSEESLAHGQRLQLMGTLTGGIAHEFNNFLTPITGYADLIMAEADPGSEIYDNAAEISEAAQKAQDVVRQISSMSRKNVETVYEPVPVAKLVDNTRKLVETNCPKQVTLQEELHLNGEDVLGNATQLQQVLLNICINAIHAIGREEGTLTLRAESVPRSELAKRLPEEKISYDWQNYIRLSVSDNGSGMDKETLQHIFEPFFTTKKAGEGTGLGLALAEQIIRTHRGWICAESTLGKGTTFYIYLPVLEPQHAQEQLQWGQDSQLRILAADDNQKVLALLTTDFGRLGLEVVTCSRRGEVRTLLETEHFDVLAIDETLTGGSGVEFCMAIQGKYPSLTRIVMTNAPTREIVDARRHRVIDGYIVKPVSAATLLEEIRTCQRQKPTA